MKSYSHNTREATTASGILAIHAHACSRSEEPRRAKPHEPRDLPLSWHNLLHSKGEKCWHEPTKPQAKKEERPDIKQKACAEHLRQGDVS